MTELIRVKSLHIENIKNVSNGTIEFPDYDENTDIKSNIVGLYGQNGSGKTAAVNAFRIIQKLISGNSILPYKDLRTVQALYSLVEMTFLVIIDEVKLHVVYSVKVAKVGQLEETLSYKNLISDEKSSVTVSEEAFNKNKVFLPVDRNNDFGINKSNELSYMVTRQTSINAYQSFLFNREFNVTFIENLHDEYFKKIMNVLPKYITKHTFIIENSRSANSSINLVFPIGLLFINSDGEEQYVDNTFGYQDNKCYEHQYKAIKQGIESINSVIKTIIPNLSVDIRETSETKTAFGEKEYTFKMVAVRDGMEFPYAWESDGIKKIISFISCLIHMYNHESSFVVVDEFDSEVFEFLIGEILQVLKEGGKGQMFFTSHNLRPLEILDPKDIWFATTNPQKRYIQFKNVKSNHNLRDLYFRTIQLGGQKEEIYLSTDQYKIRNAFTKVEK